MDGGIKIKLEVQEYQGREERRAGGGYVDTFPHVGSFPFQFFFCSFRLYPFQFTER